MPGDSMARMIQMIAALSEIQQRRRAADLEDRRFEEGKRQFGAQMGFNEKSAESKKVADLLDAIARSSSESRAALGELGTSLGLDETQIQALMHYGQTAPETMEMMKTKDIAAGRANMPAPQRAIAQNEAAIGSMTGMNQGGMAMSQLQSVLAGGGDPTAAYGKDMLRNMVQGFGERVATGRGPLEAGVQGRIMADPNLMAQMAGIQAGNVSPQQNIQNQQQSRQLDIAGQQAQSAAMGVTADFYRTNAQIIANASDATAKAASAKAVGGLTPEAITAVQNSMRETMEAIQKAKNPAARAFFQAQYNELAKRIGGRQIPIEGEQPGPPGSMDRMNPMTPGPAGMPTQPHPGYATPPLFSTPQPNFLQPNPMQPFVRP